MHFPEVSPNAVWQSRPLPPEARRGIMLPSRVLSLNIEAVHLLDDLGQKEATLVQLPDNRRRPDEAAAVSMLVSDASRLLMPDGRRALRYIQGESSLAILEGAPPRPDQTIQVMRSKFEALRAQGENPHWELAGYMALTLSDRGDQRAKLGAGCFKFCGGVLEQIHLGDVEELALSRPEA